MTNTLITGANKGLGFETARQLIAAGHTVYAGARDPDRGRRAAAELGARFVRLDVTDDASVEAAVKAIEADGGLDVLVNNAGVEPRLPGGGFLDARGNSADAMRAAFETNVFGVVRVLHAFEYPSSKAALNMLTVQYAKAFPHIRINAVDPGFTATDLNYHAGTQTAEEGAAIIVRMARIGADGPTGTFQNAAGRLSW
jgi:NAD(P)-dependent dehydrogenase (short-subunit alcohol dehydrogenase family)